MKLKGLINFFAPLVVVSKLDGELVSEKFVFTNKSAQEWFAAHSRVFSVAVRCGYTDRIIQYRKGA